MTCKGPELLNWIVGCISSPVPLTILSWSRKQFEMSTTSFRRLSIGVCHAVLTQISLNERYQAVLAFHEDTDPNDELLELLRSTATKAVDQWQTARSYEDGLALFDLIMYSHDNFFEVMKSSIIPKVIESCGHLTAFMFGFLHKWDQSMRRKQISLKEAKPIYEDLVRVTVEKMNTSSLATEEIHESKRFRDNQDSNRSMTALVSYQTLHRFAVSLFQPGFEERRNMFIEKIYVEARSFKATNFETLWIPLLQDLLFGCEKYKISLSIQCSQQLYQGVLEAFLLNYVGKVLPEPGLVRKRVSCPCADCRTLNQFLVDPTQPVGRFRMNTARRQHLHQKLDASGIDCTHITERGGTTYTLVVTKTGKQYEEHSKVQNRRKITAAKYLFAFDQQKLRTVLADKYDAIMLMKMLEHPESAATGSAVSSSTRRREPLAPVSANPTEEIARLDAEMERLANSTPSSAPASTKTTTNYGTPMSPASSSQTISRGATAMQTRTFASPRPTIVSGRRIRLSRISSTPSMFERVLDNNSTSGLVPTHQTIRHPSTWRVRPPLRTPGNRSPALGSIAATRAVSNPSRPPPTTMIPHPVASAKRKFVELIDLTLDDD
ncbi:hypothetical protein HD806DRAFT_287713 [Xylariaceae sp. AK1471]|nr:hypothetical protein HD806DRAFT_287713 [Xylariaceae sp. AK1471]